MEHIQGCQRDRILLLSRLFREESDEGHPVPMTRIQEYLEEHGQGADRKSVYRDVSALRRYGFDIQFRAGRNNGGWYLDAAQGLSREEIRRIADAVGVYPLLTAEQRDALLEKLIELVPRPQRRGMCRRVARRRLPEGWVTTSAENLDRIHQAIQQGKTLRFRPANYQDGKRIGPQRIITPKELVWTEENYRLLAWDHKTQRLLLLRLDEMEEVGLMTMEGMGPETHAGSLLLPFGPARGRVETVRFSCPREMLREILDRFGPDVPLTERRGRLSFTAKVVVSHGFWDWMERHWDAVTVFEPTWLQAEWMRWREKLSQNLHGDVQEKTREI